MHVSDLWPHHLGRIVSPLQTSNKEYTLSLLSPIVSHMVLRALAIPWRQPLNKTAFGERTALATSSSRGGTWRQRSVWPGTTTWPLQPLKTNKNVHFWQFQLIWACAVPVQHRGHSHSFHGDASTFPPGRVHIHSREFISMLLNANMEPTPVSWPQRSSLDVSSAKCRWWWGWASERWTTTGHAGWCSHSSCENAPLETVDRRKTEEGT